MATVTKRDLSSRITALLEAAGTPVPQQVVHTMIQTLVMEITNAVARGDKVVLRNFGTFEPRLTKAKIGRNPKDPRHDVPIPARRVVKFKPGKEIRATLAETDTPAKHPKERA
jgi:nucleoid DNA-binding protein